MFRIETFRATLEKAVAILQKHQIRFHLTGGVTSIAYGEPRMTQDVDIVVDNTAVQRQLIPFLQSLRESAPIHVLDSSDRAIWPGGTRIAAGVEILPRDA